MAAWRATYRLQLGPDLDFAGARSLVPYLRDLGISHLYLSPSLQARPGSTHGYDVVDPRRISDELGGEAEFRKLAEAAREAGMGILLDIVPNHMATDEEHNELWRDPELRRRFFDLDPETGLHRRFFDIGELGGVRQEDPEVFEATHRKVLELAAEGLVDGFRIDHPDGLANPREYLERLREHGARHVWVEKILEPGEELRSDWATDGTTGYEFASDVTALFVDPAGELPLTELYVEFTGERRSYHEIAAEAKLEQARTTFQPEVERLRRLLDVEGIEEALASLHVYRTYIEPGRPPAPEDHAEIERAGLSPAIADALLGEGHDEFTTRFQQTSGPVMAKGIEDTAFYRYLRLVALNEVGGDPSRFSLSVRRFHEANLRRAERYPLHLLTSQTHDAKRSGDVRARIGVLAALAPQWRERVLRWRELNAPLRDGAAPDANEEYLIYQTLVGAWPLELDRLEDYLEKALREGKRNTNWIDPDEAWEAGVRTFVRRLYEHDAFLEDLEDFAEVVAAESARVAAAQLLLRLTVPGVPDLYQGDELEALSLVDPDNRRPVHWELRRRLLDELSAGAPPTGESLKLHLIHEALALRARRPDAFSGAYVPVEAGPDVVAFCRGEAVAVIVPLRADGVADPFVLGDGDWENLVPRTPFFLGERR